ncbi:MAG: hypothetical protein M1838_002653 [Thelocarpon superellum]|nr:MAG: hypothetical protein M1838_002653 [Thelocarpon superellum]
MYWVYNAGAEVNAISQYPEILAVCVTLTSVMVIVVGLRMYVRSTILRSVGADDWTILVAAACSCIYNGMCIGQSRWGLGLPVALRPQENLNPYTLLNYPGRPFYMIGITGFKVALCLAYLRIVNRDNRYYRPLIWTIMITCVLGHLGGTLVLIFQCRPVEKNWHPLVPGSCLPNAVTFYVLAAITIFFDCIIFTLPIPLLARVQINMRRKVALIGVFVLGLFTTVCSVMRMVQIRQITKDGNSTGLVLWGTIEMNVGISLTCLPALTPLFAYFREKHPSARVTPHGTFGSNGSGTRNKRSHTMQYYSRKADASNSSTGSDELECLELGWNGRLPTAPELQQNERRGFVRGRLGGIIRTTELDVKVSNAHGNGSASSEVGGDSGGVGRGSGSGSGSGSGRGSGSGNGRGSTGGGGADKW